MVLRTESLQLRSSEPSANCVALSIASGNQAIAEADRTVLPSVCY